ncbi:MAG: toprim domain-containing protein [Candidatus Wallbacteria bacterium]|nr:toprim domain-containing protein [Candidatus Wallbacteria bacterium]
MPGQHRVVFNAAALSATDEVILCECPFDALTFWAAGFKNVISAYGTNGFTQIHREALRRHEIRRVLIAYDNDDAGNPAADKLAPELLAAGIECFRIRLPHGMDVNEYASKLKPAAKTLGIAIRAAEWMGKGSAPEHSSRSSSQLPGPSPFAASASEPAPRPTVPAPDSELPGQLLLFQEPGQVAGPATPPPQPATPPATPPEPAPKGEASSPPRASEESTAPSEPLTPEASTVTVRTPPAASPVPPPPTSPTLTIVSDNEVTLARAERRYRVRGLAANTRLDALRVNLLAESPLGVHVDTLDLFHAKARATFERLASLELGCPEAFVHADILALLRALDELQDSALKKAHPPKEPTPAVSDTDRADALTLLRDPQLVHRILADFEAAGVVGERTNTLVGYLAAISRKLDRPLALVVQSSSSAGKSTLMDAICDFVPEEDRIQFSAMTGQALFYMGETNLAQKVLAIVEEEGAERASYALKLLQSEGRLTIASTGKDPATGKLITHQYSVEGPVMIFLTTTSSDLDDELANRCLILSVNEERSQTRAIHERQRHRRNLGGLLADNTREHLRKLHQNAQRLIRPLPVINPFVHLLTFVDDKTRTRRDHEKYLTLIDTLALLHQHQRPLKSVLHRGGALQYIEVTLDDIRLANQLAHEVLGRSLDELPPQTRRLLSHLDAMVTQECSHLECSRSDYRFTRKQLRDVTGWTDFQVCTHLDKLVSLEYLLVHRGMRGSSFVYELLYDGGGSDGKPYLMGLLDVDRLADTLALEHRGDTGHEYVPKFEGSKSEFEPQGLRFEPASSPQRAPDVPPASQAEKSEKPHETSSSQGSNPESVKTTYPVTKRRSYSPPARTRGAPRSGSAPAAAAAISATAAAAHKTPPPGGNGRSHPRRRPQGPPEET